MLGSDWTSGGLDRLKNYISGWQAKRQPVSESEQFNQRNLYIFPAREGFRYLLLVFLVWMLGTIYENNLVLLLAFFLVAVFVSTIFSTHSNLEGLTLRVGDSDPVFVGEQLQIPLLFDNKSNRWRRRIFVSYEGQEHVVDIPPVGQAKLYLRIAATKRGWLALGRLRVYTRYPLGILHSWSWPLLRSRALVYPQPVAKDTTSDSGSSGAGFAPAGRGMDDFAGLQAWQPGVPVQRIAWKQFSAGRGMMEKAFEAQTSNPVWIDWDAYQGVDLESRLSAMCAKAVEMEGYGQSYGLRMPQVKLVPSQGERHLRQLLTALAVYPEVPEF